MGAGIKLDMYQGQIVYAIESTIYFPGNLSRRAQTYPNQIDIVTSLHHIYGDNDLFASVLTHDGIYTEFMNQFLYFRPSCYIPLDFV